VNVLRQTKFEIALYTQEPIESDLTLHEFKHPDYARKTAAVEMYVDPDSTELVFITNFSADFGTSLYGEIEYMALLADSKLIRAKSTPCVITTHSIYTFTYSLKMTVHEFDKLT
jgi:hypothetical protein